jgi:hypothetical protein
MIEFVCRQCGETLTPTTTPGVEAWECSTHGACISRSVPVTLDLEAIRPLVGEGSPWFVLDTASE